MRKLRVATLLACIGTGGFLLANVYQYIKYGIVDRSDYWTIEQDFWSIFHSLCWIFILIFLITFYKNQSKIWER